MSKQPPPAPTTSAVGPCPTVNKIVERPGTGSLPSTIAPPDHPIQCRGILLIWIRGGQRPTALAVAAGGCLAIFSLVYHFSYLKWGGRVVRWCWVNFQSRGVLLILIIVGQGPTALAVGAGEGCLDIFSRVYHFSFPSSSSWKTARYRLKYCLKWPLSPK